MYSEKEEKKFPKDNKYNNDKEPKIGKNDKKKKTKIVILIFFAIIAIIASTIFFGVSLFKYINTIGKLEYIELGNDRIPTIYIRNNNIEIDSYYKDIETDEIEIEIEYYDNLYKNNIIDAYVNYLEEYGFEYIESNECDWYLIKESIDKGKVITISIYENYDYDGELFFTIVYEKKKDILSNYIKKTTYKRIGEEKYGFIDIDSTWQPYLDDKDIIQYKGEDGFLTLYYNENINVNAREYMTEIYNSISKEENIIDLTINEVTIDGYNAYQLSGYYPYENIYTAIWCFLDKDNIMHYIEINSKKYNSEAFAKIESYSIYE